MGGGTGNWVGRRDPTIHAPRGGILAPPLHLQFHSPKHEPKHNAHTQNTSEFRFSRPHPNPRPRDHPNHTLHHEGYPTPHLLPPSLSPPPPQTFTEKSATGIRHYNLLRFPHPFPLLSPTPASHPARAKGLLSSSGYTKLIPPPEPTPTSSPQPPFPVSSSPNVLDTEM